MTTPSKTVLINGIKHACPFDRLFRPLTADERAGLLDSGRLIGFHHPVLTYDSPAHGPAVIDGVNRAELADQHGLPLLVTHLGEMSDDQAELIARRVNADRRHLTADEQRAARAARIERVAEARAAGKSFRSIADEEGVSVPQLYRDLADAGVTPVTPASVVGRDGKQYPASRPATASGVTGVTPEPADTDGPDPGDMMYSAAPPGYEPGDDPTPPAHAVDRPYPARPAGLDPDDHTRPPAPARPEYPEPFASLLKDLTALATKFGKLINSPEGDKLVHYVGLLVKAGVIRRSELIRHRDVVVNGRVYKSQWSGFAGLRHLLKLASRSRTVPLNQLKQGYQDAIAAEETNDD